MRKCKACGKRLWPWGQYEGVEGEVVCEECRFELARAKERAFRRSVERVREWATQRWLDACRDPGPTERKDEALKLVTLARDLAARW